MSSVMVIELAFVNERSSTPIILAYVRLIGEMPSMVQREVVAPRKGRSAILEVAEKGLLTRMPAAMSSELRCINE